MPHFTAFFDIVSTSSNRFELKPRMPIRQPPTWRVGNRNIWLSTAVSRNSFSAPKGVAKIEIQWIHRIEFLKFVFSLFSFNTPRLIAPGLCSYIASCCGGAAQQKIIHSTIPSTDSWEILKPRLRFSQFHAYDVTLAATRPTPVKFNMVAKCCKLVSCHNLIEKSHNLQFQESHSDIYWKPDIFTFVNLLVSEVNRFGLPGQALGRAFLIDVKPSEPVPSFGVGWGELQDVQDVLLERPPSSVNHMC